MLDYDIEELEKLATIYNLKIKQLSENLFIQSKYDEWYISDNGYVISLYHRNKKFQLKHYHLQRKFMNDISFEFLFKYINNHDIYIEKHKYTTTNNVLKLLNMLNNTNQNKSKLLIK